MADSCGATPLTAAIGSPVSRPSVASTSTVIVMVSTGAPQIRCASDAARALVAGWTARLQPADDLVRVVLEDHEARERAARVDSHECPAQRARAPREAAHGPEPAGGPSLTRHARAFPA